jgi:hypothetical protein
VEWHTFAKLRMQTEPTIDHLEKLTAELGRVTRDFKQKVCAKYNTFELPRETAARGRREQRRTQAASASVARSTAASTSAAAQPEPDPSVIAALPPQPSTQNAPSAPALKKKKKILNLNTYKYHSLGDYIRFIRLFGPTDSYSTQLVRIVSIH